MTGKAHYMNGMSSIPIVTNVSVDSVIELLGQFGTVMLRNTGYKENEFVAFANQLMRPWIHHASAGDTRERIDDAGFTTTVDAGTHPVPLHREQGYLPHPPDIIMFYCETPSQEGGETLLCDGRDLLLKLPESLRERLAYQSLTWDLTLPPARWKATLEATSIDHAARRLSGMATQIRADETFSAHFDGEMLHTRFKTTCISLSRSSGNVFCNSLLVHYYLDLPSREANSMSRGLAALLNLANLNEFSPLDIDLVKSVADGLTVPVKWQAGDILIIDNSRYMHGRAGFTGTRRILARMGHVS